jgi:hypothetical protein
VPIEELASREFRGEVLESLYYIRLHNVVLI